MTCPGCGSSAAYVGFSAVECPNPRCRHFKGPDQLPLADAMTQRGIPLDVEHFRQIGPQFMPGRLPAIFLSFVRCGRVHPRWRRLETGRWMAAQPNVLNLKRDVQPCFQVRSVTFPSLELYVTAKTAQIDEVCAWYEAGKDVYLELSKRLNQTREATKYGVFEALYEAGRPRFPTVTHRVEQRYASELRSYRQATPDRRTRVRRIQQLVSNIVTTAAEAVHEADHPICGIYHDTLWFEQTVDLDAAVAAVQTVRNLAESKVRVVSE